MSYQDEYRTRADDLANTLEMLATQLRTRGYNAVASSLASEWLGPLVSDLAALGQFAELCRVWDARQ